MDFLPWAQGVSPGVLKSLAWERPSRDSQPLNKRLAGFPGLSALRDLLEDSEHNIEIVIIPLQDIHEDEELLIYYETRRDAPQLLIRYSCDRSDYLACYCFCHYTNLCVSFLVVSLKVLEMLCCLGIAYSTLLLTHQIK
eukprot:g12162.t1